VKPIRASALSFGAYGVMFRLHAEAAPAAADLIRERAAVHGWTDGDAQDAELEYAVCDRGGTLELTCNGETLYRTSDAAALAAAFEDHAKIELALRARGHVFVHAGVVGWRGDAIVIPGKSGTGKTSLVEALVRAGADYYSDEFAILDREGRVHPYPVPLSIRTRGSRVETTAETLGGHTGSMPLPIGRIVLTEFRRGGRWRPRAMSPGIALLGLMANTVAAARQPPDRTMPVLRRVVEQATAVRGVRGDAAVTARALLAASGRRW
jgi:hypothetical protein